MLNNLKNEVIIHGEQDFRNTRELRAWRGPADHFIL